MGQRAQVAWLGGDARQGPGGWRRGWAALRVRDGETLLGNRDWGEQRFSPFLLRDGESSASNHQSQHSRLTTDSGQDSAWGQGEGGPMEEHLLGEESRRHLQRAALLCGCESPEDVGRARP